MTAWPGPDDVLHWRSAPDPGTLHPLPVGREIVALVSKYGMEKGDRARVVDCYNLYKRSQLGSDRVLRSHTIFRARLTNRDRLRHRLSNNIEVVAAQAGKEWQWADEMTSPHTAFRRVTQDGDLQAYRTLVMLMLFGPVEGFSNDKTSDDAADKAFARLGGDGMTPQSVNAMAEAQVFELIRQHGGGPKSRVKDEGRKARCIKKAAAWWILENRRGLLPNTILECGEIPGLKESKHLKQKFLEKTWAGMAGTVDAHASTAAPSAGRSLVSSPRIKKGDAVSIMKDINGEHAGVAGHVDSVGDDGICIVHVAMLSDNLMCHTNDVKLVTPLAVAQQPDTAARGVDPAYPPSGSPDVADEGSTSQQSQRPECTA